MCHLPNQRIINFSIFVDQDIALSDNSGPGNLRVYIPKLKRDSTRCLSNDLKMAFDSAS